MTGSALARLSDIERRAFEYIKSSIKKYGYSPSVRDIQRALEIRSSSTAYAVIEQLEIKGYVTKENGKSRSIRINEPELPSDSVPLLGRITAGLPVLALENHEGYVTFAASTVGCSQDELFALRISGDSMIEAGIMDGDIVIIKRTDYAENGEIVAAMVDDCATVKTFYKENGGYRLKPENKAMKPILADEVSILGKVVASIRIY